MELVRGESRKEKAEGVDLCSFLFDVDYLVGKEQAHVLGSICGGITTKESVFIRFTFMGVR